MSDLFSQHHQFHIITLKKIWRRRYFKIAEKIYKELDERLSVSKFLAGKDYTIADIATFPWIADMNAYIIAKFTILMLV